MTYKKHYQSSNQWVYSFIIYLLLFWQQVSVPCFCDHKKSVPSTSTSMAQSMRSHHLSAIDLTDGTTNAMSAPSKKSMNMRCHCGFNCFCSFLLMSLIFSLGLFLRFYTEGFWFCFKTSTYSPPYFAIYHPPVV